MMVRFDWVSGSRLGVCAGLVSLVLAVGQSAEAQLRVVTYNTAEGARPEMATVFEAIGSYEVNSVAKPIDVLLLQEQTSWDTTTQGIVDILNGIYGPGTYGLAQLDGGTMGAGRPGLVYNTNTVQLIGAIAFGNISTTEQARQTLRYQLRPVGYDSSADFYAYNSHYKAGDTTIDQQRRLVEATAIRTNADALGSGVNIIYAGDFNMQSSNQAAYQKLLEAGPGQAFDPIDSPGSWHMNTSFVDIHTQSPCATGDCPNGFTGGGMDDRFDLQIVTAAMMDGQGLSYIGPTVPGMSGLVHSYHAFGNNNTHTFKGSITTGTWPQPGVLDALWASSDHLPVVADFQVPAIMEAVAGMVPATLTLGQAFQLDVNVSNAANVVAAIGADALNYSLTTSGSVGGTFLNQTDVALSGGNTHFVTLDTSTTGPKSGLITLSSNSHQVANGFIQIPVSYEVISGTAPPQPIVIAQWTFEESGPSISGTGTTFGPIAPEEGNGAARGVHASASTAWSSPVGNGSAHSFSSNNWAIGDYYEFQVSTLGLRDISLEFDQVSSGTGPRDFQVQYSNDGTTFTDFGSIYMVRANSSPNWSSVTPVPDGLDTFAFDLSSITPLNDQENIFLRLVVASNTSANNGTILGGGTSRVDNVTIIGTPIVGLLGDFNGDGVVDAADYVWWRKHSGDPGEYQTWRENFGNTASGSGALASAAVPEPSAALLAALGICLASLGRGTLKGWSRKPSL